MECMFTQVFTNPKSHDCCWNLKEENIDYNHVEHPFELFSIVDDKVEPRIQYKRLARNHSIPADGNESNGDVVIFPDLEELHEKRQCVDHNSP
jgi:hypothetical protein